MRIRAPLPEPAELDVAAALLRAAKQPVIVAGGGVLYSDGGAEALRAFAETHRVPVAETQAGKSALPWDHPLQAGPVGVTGATAANTLAHDADLVLAVGTRLSDFTTGSHSLFPQAKIVAINVNAFDALKWRADAVQGDAARDARGAVHAALGMGERRAVAEESDARSRAWRTAVSAIVGVREVETPALPYDGEVIGAVQRSHPHSAEHDIVICAAGTLPAELHKLWRAAVPGGYHMEYGYSCMGYEIAGGIGVKMAHPNREVVVMVGDGSYLMLNSEIATSVMLGTKLVIVVLDNRGYGCIHRLQRAVGGEGFNNLFDDCVQGSPGMPAIDFAAHARSLGALGGARGLDRRARGGADTGARGRPHVRRGDRHRSAAHDRGRRLVVGSGRAGSVRIGRACARRASNTSTASGCSDNDEATHPTRSSTCASASIRSRGPTTIFPRWVARRRSKPR